MAHTPGPWWYDKRTESIGCPSGWLGKVQLTRKADPSFGNPDDDGQLMAAAPELLAALKAIEWIDGQDTAPGMAGMMEQVCFWCDKVGTPDDGWAHNPDCIRQAALDKARGECAGKEVVDDTRD